MAGGLVRGSGGAAGGNEEAEGRAPGFVGKREAHRSAKDATAARVVDKGSRVGARSRRAGPARDARDALETRSMTRSRRARGKERRKGGRRLSGRGVAFRDGSRSSGSNLGYYWGLVNLGSTGSHLIPVPVPGVAYGSVAGRALASATSCLMERAGMDG